jgi:thiol:disulfide interchange protein DsbD
MFKKSMRFVTLLFLLAGVGVAVFGQTVNGIQITRAELISDSDDFTKPFTVGIRFVLEPDWYLYWKNPGDSGLPIDVKWDLPKGWMASEVRHPVPAKFVYDNMVSYGYKKEVILLATISPGSEPLDVLNVKLDWLVCKESCVRGKAEVSLSLTQYKNHRQAAVLMREAEKKLPGLMSELAFTAGPVRLRETQHRWEAEVDLAGQDASSVSDFYPEPIDDILIEFSTIRIDKGILRFQFILQNRTIVTKEIRGLFIAGTRGFQGTIPIHLKSM